MQCCARWTSGRSRVLRGGGGGGDVGVGSGWGRGKWRWRWQERLQCMWERVHGEVERRLEEPELRVADRAVSRRVMSVTRPLIRSGLLWSGLFWSGTHQGPLCPTLTFITLTRAQVLVDKHKVPRGMRPCSEVHPLRQHPQEGRGRGRGRGRHARAGLPGRALCVSVLKAGGNDQRELVDPDRRREAVDVLARPPVAACGDRPPEWSAARSAEDSAWVRAGSRVRFESRLGFVLRRRAWGGCGASC